MKLTTRLADSLATCGREVRKVRNAIEEGQITEDEAGIPTSVIDNAVEAVEAIALQLRR